MTNLKELLTRVKAAAGPDRELDAKIFCAICDGYELGKNQLGGLVVTNGGVRWSATDIVPYLTDSIDSALAFAERVLPGLCPGVSQNVFHLSWHAWLGSQREGASFTVAECSHDINGPLAILAATLTALIAQEDAQ